MNRLALVDPDPVMEKIPADMRRRMDKNTRDLMAVKDIDGRKRYVNDVWYLWQNLDPGKFDPYLCDFSEIPSKPYRTCSEQYRHTHNTNLRESRTVVTFQVHEWLHREGWRASVTTNTQLRDENDRVYGVVSQCRLLPEIYAKNHHKIREKMGVDEKESVMRLENPDELNDTEFDTLYFMMMGYNTGQIALLRNISTSGVYNCLDRIKFKYGLDNTDQLVEFAMDRRWYEFLPRALRNTESVYPLNDDAALANGGHTP